MHCDIALAILLKFYHNNFEKPYDIQTLTETYQNMGIKTEDVNDAKDLILLGMNEMDLRRGEENRTK